ncbi:hypothetical protein ACHAXM_000746 [Skeletonema potamos]
MKIILHNSLRDLLGTPNDKNYEILSNKNKNKSPNDELLRSGSIDTSSSNADNFNNMLNPQRRNKFQGRLSSQEEDYNDANEEDNDELGLNMDRLRAFSFAGLIAKENTRVKQGVKGSSSSKSSSTTTTNSPDANNNHNDNFYYHDVHDDTIRANDFNNMIGIAYSKKHSPSFFSSTNRNPSTQQISSKDVDQETGMHIDKVSTFSFSSQNTKSVFLENNNNNNRRLVVSGSNGGSSLQEQEVIIILVKEWCCRW